MGQLTYGKVKSPFSLRKIFTALRVSLSEGALRGVGEQTSKCMGSVSRLLYVEEKYGLKFPCSENLLREVWGAEFGDESYKKSIIALLGEGVIHYAKVPEVVFFESVVNLSENKDKEGNRVLFGAFYSSELYREIREEVVGVSLGKNKRLNEGIEISRMSERMEEFVGELKKVMRDEIGLTVSVESFEEFEDEGEAEFNFLVEDDRGEYFLGWANEILADKVKEQEDRYEKIDGLEMYVEGAGRMFLMVGIGIRSTRPDIYDVVNLLMGVMREFEREFSEYNAGNVVEVGEDS